MPDDTAPSPPPASSPASAGAPVTRSGSPPASELGVGRPTKRRPGAAVGGLPVADPRPVFEPAPRPGADRGAPGSVVAGAVLGVRCGTCRYPVAQAGIPWCPACYAPVAPERFAASGVVWSSTVIAIPVGPLRPPFGLAYLDLDDGPRVLVRLAEPAVVPIGTRLTITGTDGGDLVAARQERS
jgi:hypothetical protein